jgi:hypothetical protein
MLKRRKNEKLRGDKLRDLILFVYLNKNMVERKLSCLGLKRNWVIALEGYTARLMNLDILREKVMKYA